MFSVKEHIVNGCYIIPHKINDNIYVEFTYGKSDWWLHVKKIDSDCIILVHPEEFITFNNASQILYHQMVRLNGQCSRIVYNQRYWNDKHEEILSNWITRWNVLVDKINIAFKQLSKCKSANDCLRIVYKMNMYISHLYKTILS